MTMKDEPHGVVDERFARYAEFPVGLGRLSEPGGTARMVGQCGDSIGVEVLIEDAVLTAVRVQPEGCVYTRVCAGAMSALAQGLEVDEALRIEPLDIAAELGGLPEDHLHCARLALNALGEAVADYYLRRSGRGGEAG